jgi:hypothetical protein
MGINSTHFVPKGSVQRDWIPIEELSVSLLSLASEGGFEDDQIEVFRLHIICTENCASSQISVQSVPACTIAITYIYDVVKQRIIVFSNHRIHEFILPTLSIHVDNRSFRFYVLSFMYSTPPKAGQAANSWPKRPIGFGC